MHVYIDLFYTWDKVLYIVYKFSFFFSLRTHTHKEKIIIIIATNMCTTFSKKKINTHTHTKQVFYPNHTNKVNYVYT